MGNIFPYGKPDKTAQAYRGSRIKEAGESVLGADWGICPGGRLEDGIIGCTL